MQRSGGGRRRQQEVPPDRRRRRSGRTRQLDRFSKGIRQIEVRSRLPRELTAPRQVIHPLAQHRLARPEQPGAQVRCLCFPARQLVRTCLQLLTSLRGRTGRLRELTAIRCPDRPGRWSYVRSAGDDHQGALWLHHGVVSGAAGTLQARQPRRARPGRELQPAARPRGGRRALMMTSFGARYSRRRSSSAGSDCVGGELTARATASRMRAVGDR